MCVLEQIIPAGPGHPFAKTMLDHFAKSAPLQSVLKYQTLADQKQRFEAHTEESKSIQSVVCHPVNIVLPIA